MTLDLSTIEQAARVIRAATRLTPAWPSAILEQITAVPVTLKCEQLQRTGSFKVRGALNFVANLPADGVLGLVAASAGNHAQGVAYAASLRGLPVTVVMPSFAPLAKVNAAKGYGARVVLHGLSLEQARDHARTIAANEGLIFVPPFDDDHVIAGQGTLGLELLAQAPHLSEVLVPTGGGGLLAGVATAIKESNPAIRVIGVQAAAMDGVARSFAAGSLIEVPPRRTIADGVAVAGPSERTFTLVRRYVDEIVTVPEDAIAHALLLLVERSKMVVEGAGALGVAALQSGLYRPKGPAAVILSGGNIDINLIGSIIRRGLVDAGRYQQLSIQVSDTPGELAAITAAIASEGGNILEVEHNREAPQLPVGVAILDLVLEVDGPEHFDRVVAALTAAGITRVGSVSDTRSSPAARTRNDRRE
ncbi:MAG: threonine ammonia-lyase [Dehalococcoidia bacterium]|nr:threonine ammonia-lyase [Dehalococcoidia bacterium]